MFCQSCGTELSRPTKYCKKCGAQLSAGKESTDLVQAETNLREEMVDLFWLTVYGLGLILGGMFLIKRVLHLSEWMLIVYMALSSAAFSINFALSLWQIRRLAGISKEARSGGDLGKSAAADLPGGLDTNELQPAAEQRSLEASASITEGTTRDLGTV